MFTSLLNQVKRFSRKRRQSLRRIRRSSNRRLGKLTNNFFIIFMLVVGAVFLIVNLESTLRGEPVGSWREFFEGLSKSVVLNSLESISIVTALVFFLLVGRHEQKNLKHSIAWAVLDLANRRETSPGRTRSLQELNEDDVSLARLDFPGADLFGVQLQGADLHEATLTNACLEKADLSGADLSSANLLKVTLAKANLEQARLELANLEAADLHLANLWACGLLGANLTQANLRATDLTETDLRHADLTGAVLSQADLRGADLASSNLMNADLTETDFRGAKNLEIDQVKCAKNWELAKYDADFWSKLYPSLSEPELLSHRQSNNDSHAMLPWVISHM